ncbi:hypothetical protein GQ457_13G008240 [Hibiscus cannabinus]
MILPPSESSCISIAASGILNTITSSYSMDSSVTGEVLSKSLPRDLFHLCLNTDVAICLPERLGTIGDVCRDSSGEWIKVTASLLVFFSPLQAELWSILVGLQLTWSIGVSYLQVQFDNFVVVRLVVDLW